MSAIILATIGIVFAAGYAIGASIERGFWELALKRNLERIEAEDAATQARLEARLEARHAAAARRGRLRLIEGDAPATEPYVDIALITPCPAQDNHRPAAEAA